MKYKEKESKRERARDGQEEEENGARWGVAKPGKLGRSCGKKGGGGDKIAERDEREGGGRARGRREYMTLSVGLEGYFENVIGRKLLRTSLG